MDKTRLDEMRKFYHSLLGMKKVLERISGDRFTYQSIAPIMAELGSLDTKFPDLFPARYDFKDYFKEEFSKQHRSHTVDRLGIESILIMAIARLEVALDDQSNTPITEHRQFAFINNTQLKRIIERDYTEIQKSYIAECWKSVIILCGGTIEAILTDLLLANDSKAKAAKSAPHNKADITRWNLSELIDVAVELDMVTAGVEKLSAPIREYRNLVHSGNELRNKLQFGSEEARIAVEVLNIVHRDLSTTRN